MALPHPAAYSPHSRADDDAVTAALDLRGVPARDNPPCLDDVVAHTRSNQPFLGAFAHAASKEYPTRARDRLIIKTSDPCSLGTAPLAAHELKRRVLDCANLNTTKPVHKLKPGEGNWLNDELLNATVLLLQARANASGLAEGRGACPRVHVWNSFFYTTLAKPDNLGIANVERWLKKLKYSLLDCELVIVPVNVDGKHWVHAVIDVNSRNIEYRDSMDLTDAHTRILVRSRATACSPWRACYSAFLHAAPCERPGRARMVDRLGQPNSTDNSQAASGNL